MSGDWSNGLDLFLDLDRRGGLRAGIEHALREAVRDGRLTPGTALPSSRSLARDLAMARGTVSAAYGQLAAEGYLEIRQGAPVRVSRHHPRLRAQPARSPAPAGTAGHSRWDFRPGRPESTSFPRTEWLRACRQAIACAPALVEWARRRDGLIVEDDYDGEFRYDRQPLGALQRLDPDHVIYAGTASKTLAPGLRLGWLSAPDLFQDALAVAKDESDRGTGILDQLALSEFIASGTFDRHVRRMRTRYRRRRDALAQVISQNRPDLRLAGIAAGLHAVVHMPEGKPTEDHIQAQAAERSIALHTLGEYWQVPPQPASAGIIVGYAAPASHAYRPALDALAALLTAL